MFLKFAKLKRLTRVKVRMLTLIGVGFYSLSESGVWRYLRNVDEVKSTFFYLKIIVEYLTTNTIIYDKLSYKGICNCISISL